jgi:hypothetical protein
VIFSSVFQVSAFSVAFCHPLALKPRGMFCSLGLRHNQSSPRFNASPCGGPIWRPPGQELRCHHVSEFRTTASMIDRRSAAWTMPAVQGSCSASRPVLGLVQMKLYPEDWRVRITTAVVIAACLIAVRLLGPAVGLEGFWPWMLAVIVGIVLGRLVGQLLFGPSSGGPGDHPPQP